MSLNLECLKDNLQILYVAAPHCTKEKSPVIANWGGTNLLIKNVGLTGWCWTQVFEKSSWAGYEGIDREKLRAALLLTHQTFSEEQKRAVDAQLVYIKSLQRLIRNEQVPPETFRASRETLCAWHSATSEWTKFLKTKESRGIKNWLNELSKIEFQKPHFFAHKVLKVSAQLRRFFKIIALDGYVQMLFAPLLFKTACSQPLNKNEKKDLNALSHKINKHSESMGVRTFEKALIILNDLFKQENLKASLVEMKMALIYAKCEIFFQKDVKYFCWRNTLKPGSTVFWGERELTLGEQLGVPIQPRKDRNRVFAVVEDASIVLSFGVNQALYDLRMEMRKTYSWGLKSVKCLDVGAERRFAVIKRLMDPIVAIKWESQEKLVQKDLAIATPIANLVDCFLKQNKMFVNFSADQIMFNKKGRLTYLKVPLEGHLNFNGLVEFVIQCSQGNPVIYQFMIARIKEHPYAVFYEKMVENALTSKPEDPSNFAAVLNTRPFFREVGFTQSIFNQGSSLHDQIIELKEECLEEIKETCYLGQKKNLPGIVSKAILTCYQNGSYIGILPDDFDDEVIISIKKVL